MSPLTRQVLVVDDSLENQLLIKSLLENHTYEVMLANDGKEALQMLAQVQPGLIISDVLMPNMDGYEFLHRLRKDERYRLIPFIFLSARDTAEDETLGLSLGADYYMGKPFDWRMLLERVDKVFQLQEKSRASIGPSELSGFAGSLAEVPVFELLQIVEIGAKSGTFELRGPSGLKGSIGINRGQLFSAEVADDATLPGVPALHLMFGWREGSFRLDRERVPLQNAIRESIANILLRWTVEQDHLHSEEESVAPEARQVAFTIPRGSFLEKCRERFTALFQKQKELLNFAICEVIPNPQFTLARTPSTPAEQTLFFNRGLKLYHRLLQDHQVPEGTKHFILSGEGGTLLASVIEVGSQRLLVAAHSTSINETLVDEIARVIRRAAHPSAPPNTSAIHISREGVPSKPPAPRRG